MVGFQSLCKSLTWALTVCSMTPAVAQPSQTSQVRAATAPAGAPPSLGTQQVPSGGNHFPQGQGDNFFTLGELVTVWHSAADSQGNPF